MPFLFSLAASQSVILFAIIVHELGHYLAARALGVKTKNFTVGIGPTFTLFTSKGTQFRISPLLLGGYVQYDLDSLDNTHPFKRVLLVLAGPAAGLLAALVPLWLLGVLYFNCGPLEAVWLSIKAEYNLAAHVAGALAGTIADIAHWLGLPVAGTPTASIADAGKFSDSYTFIKDAAGKTYLTYLAGLSVALSVLNMLPIPPLDGGRLLLDAAELATRRKLPLAAKIVPALFGVALLLFGLFASIWNDVVALL